ncbi:MAG: lipopolysaccharide biosynthesis protein [Steroidobacteraceae bacterium]
MSTLGAWINRGKTAGWPIAEQFAGPLSQLVMTPFLLHHMEAHQFALWVIAQSLLVAAPTLSFGRSIALMSVVPRFDGIERGARTLSLVRSTLDLVLVLTMAIGAITLLGNLAISQLWPWLAGSSVYLILVIGFLALSECESILTASLKSHHAFPQTASIEITARMLQVGLVLLLFGADTTVDKVLVLAMLITAIKLTLKKIVLNRLIGSHTMLLAKSDDELVHLGFWSWVNVLSGVAFYSFDRWAIEWYMGSVALGAYSVCNQLAQLTHAVPAAAAQMLIPWASERRMGLDSKHNAKQMRQVAIVSSMFACAPSISLLIFAPNILSIWISPAFSAENSVLLRHLAFLFLLLAMNIPFFDILIGLGHARYVALLSLFAGCLYVACTIIVAPKSTIGMADLKIIYAVASLMLVYKLLLVLRRPNS